jgi:hypothetical protein
VSVRAVIVGEDNPHSADPADALYPYPPNCAGERLQRLVFGVSLGSYLHDYERVNLCESGRWSTKVARERAYEVGIRASLLDARVVMLGRKVADAFDHSFTGVPREPFTAMGPYVLLPHPSGRCREWNDPASFERARKVLRAAGVI